MKEKRLEWLKKSYGFVAENGFENLLLLNQSRMSIVTNNLKVREVINQVVNDPQ